MGKKTLKNLNPIEHTKNLFKNPFKTILDPGDLAGQAKGMLTPKMPGESQAEADLRARQAADLAALDEEENRRIKKLLSGARGVRGFRGGPLSRTAPSDSAGRVTTAAGSGTAGVGAINMRAGGGRGGLVGGLRGSIRSLIQ